MSRHYGDIAAIYQRPASIDRAKPRWKRIGSLGARVPQVAERDILKAILDYLAVRHIPAWRVNTGAVPASYNGKSRFIRFNRPGAADISGILPGSGCRLEVEVKAAKGKVTPAQEQFLSMIREAGGVAGVCRSVEDVAKLLREAGVR